MRMDKVTQSFQLDYGPPGTLVKRPRLWRLTIGLLITASVAAVIPWIKGMAEPDQSDGWRHLAFVFCTQSSK